MLEPEEHDHVRLHGDEGNLPGRVGDRFRSVERDVERLWKRVEEFPTLVRLETDVSQLQEHIRELRAEVRTIVTRQSLRHIVFVSIPAFLTGLAILATVVLAK